MAKIVENHEFWKWVTERKAHDNPRGDFIRDTRDILKAGNDPNKSLRFACEKAIEEYDALLKQWKRS